MSNLVTYELADSVATVAMDDGKVNALSPAMFSELNAAFDQALADRAVVVLTGRPGVFSAGFDLRVLTGGGGGGPDLLRAGFEMSERMLTFPTPVVVACNGHALAMGLFLVLSGDYRVGAAGAFKIVANEVAIGMTMPETAVEICRQRLAAPYLNRVVNNAEVFSPDEAVTAGCLDRVVAAGELQQVARDVATGLGALDMAAHASTKLRLRSHALTAIRKAIEADDAAFRAVR